MAIGRNILRRRMEYIKFMKDVMRLYALTKVFNSKKKFPKQFPRNLTMSASRIINQINNKLGINLGTGRSFSVPTNRRGFLRQVVAVTKAKKQELLAEKNRQKIKEVVDEVKPIAKKHLSKQDKFEKLWKLRKGEVPF